MNCNELIMNDATYVIAAALSTFLTPFASSGSKHVLRYLYALRLASNSVGSVTNENSMDKPMTTRPA